MGAESDDEAQHYHVQYLEQSTMLSLECFLQLWLQFHLLWSQHLDFLIELELWLRLECLWLLSLNEGACRWLYSCLSLFIWVGGFNGLSCCRWRINCWYRSWFILYWSRLSLTAGCDCGRKRLWNREIVTSFDLGCLAILIFVGDHIGFSGCIFVFNLKSLSRLGCELLQNGLSCSILTYHYLSLWSCAGTSAFHHMDALIFGRSL